MKDFFKKLFDIHSAIGKVCTFIVIIFGVAGLIGLVFGTTKIIHKDDVVEKNYFLNENVPLHDDNYSIIINSVLNFDKVNIKNKKEKIVEIEGNFICVNLTISQNKDSSLKVHKLDKNDFKLKDHTGVYVPLNSIMGAVGWDALDIHFDEKDGGHVMSSTNFSTTNAYEDYTYINYEIKPESSLTFDLYFKMDKFVDVKKELIVLEIDFYNFSNGYRKGSDIVLLDNPFDS